MIQFRAVAFATFVSVSGLLFPAPADAQNQCPARDRSPRQLTAYEAAGHPPAEARRVEALLSCYQRQVLTISRQRGLSVRQMNAALAVFAFQNPNLTSAQLPGAIATLAGEIQTLRSLLIAAEARIDTLANVALRSSAQAALMQVQTLLEAGDMVGAAQAFAKLRPLRIGDAVTAQSQWADVVSAEAQFYLSIGDPARADQVELDAISQRNAQNQRNNWQAHLRRAERKLRYGMAFGRSSELQTAIHILENDALPLIRIPNKGSGTEEIYDWTYTQNILGLVHRSLGALSSSPTELKNAVSVFRDALRQAPGDIVLRTNLASTLVIMGSSENGISRLNEAKGELERLIPLMQSADQAVARSHAYFSLGSVLASLANRSGEIAQHEEAVRHYDQALAARASFESKTQRSGDWANIVGNRAGSVRAIGLERRDVRRLSEAGGLYQQVQQVYTLQDAPAQWAITQRNIGLVLYDTATITLNPADLDKARAAYQVALDNIDRSETPSDWAQLNLDIGRCWSLMSTAERTEGPGAPQSLQNALDRLGDALDVLNPEAEPRLWAMATIELGKALGMAAFRTNRSEWANRAIEILLRVEGPSATAGNTAIRSSLVGEIGDVVAGMHERGWNIDSNLAARISAILAARRQ